MQEGGSDPAAGPAAPGPAWYAPGPPTGRTRLAEDDGRESPYPGWPPVAPPRRRLRPTRPELVTAAGVVAALAAVGALLAPMWVQLAPRLAFRVVRPGLALPVVAEAEEYVAADGRFVLLTGAAGLLAAVVCWSLRRTRGPVVLVALAAGGLLGAVVTWRLGLRLAPSYSPQELQEVGRTVFQPLQLGAVAALVVEPFTAVLAYLLGVGFSARGDLGRDHESPR